MPLTAKGFERLTYDEILSVQIERAKSFSEKILHIKIHRKRIKMRHDNSLFVDCFITNQ